MVSISVAGYLSVLRYDTDLTTDQGALLNLLIGGAAAVSHIRRQDNNGLLGTLLTHRYLAANAPVVIYPSWGPELSPGGGIVVAPDTQNVGVFLEALVNEV
jgi:hypothetical protein